MNMAAVMRDRRCARLRHFFRETRLAVNKCLVSHSRESSLRRRNELPNLLKSLSKNLPKRGSVRKLSSFSRFSSWVRAFGETGPGAAASWLLDRTPRVGLSDPTSSQRRDNIDFVICWPRLYILPPRLSSPCCSLGIAFAFL